jgi:hypothetical protein
MCPASEIERRTRIEDIALFERVDPRIPSTNPDLAVKKFARNVSPELPDLWTELAYVMLVCQI